MNGTNYPKLYSTDLQNKRRSGRQWMCDCPVCHTHHLSVDLDKGLFHCFYAGCGFQGMFEDERERREAEKRKGNGGYGGRNGTGGYGGRNGTGGYGGRRKNGGTGGYGAGERKYGAVAKVSPKSSSRAYLHSLGADCLRREADGDLTLFCGGYEEAVKHDRLVAEVLAAREEYD